MWLGGVSLRDNVKAGVAEFPQRPLIHPVHPTPPRPPPPLVCGPPFLKLAPYPQCLSGQGQNLKSERKRVDFESLEQKEGKAGPRGLALSHPGGTSWRVPHSLGAAAVAQRVSPGCSPRLPRAAGRELFPGVGWRWWEEREMRNPCSRDPGGAPGGGRGLGLPTPHSPF